MAGFKYLRTRIESVKSTHKITSAMKLVAASRLRKSQSLIGKSQFYNHNLLACANRVYFELKNEEKDKGISYIYPEMMRENKNPQNYLLIVFTSDRGLCGNFNSSPIKETVKRIEELACQGKEVKIICVGKKGRDLLRRKYGNLILDTYEDVAQKGAKYYEGTDIALKIQQMFYNKEIDVCEAVFSKFESAIRRDVKVNQILPLNIENYEYNKLNLPTNVVHGAFYEYEPEKMVLLDGLLPLIFRGTMFQMIVNSQASEHGARMTSMDNATRNAKDVISSLTLKYNRLRQGAITTELIEIISGAEAL